MTLLYIVGPDYTNTDFVAYRLHSLPRGTTIRRASHEVNAHHTIWQVKPSLVWVFSEDMWKDKTHRWLDAAAAREIPGSHWNLQAQEARYGW